MEEQILEYLPSGHDWLTKHDAKLVRLAILILTTFLGWIHSTSVPLSHVTKSGKGMPIGNLPWIRGKESLDSQLRLVNTTPNYQFIILIF